jgi:D-beta-D-heptose 7-phosphate kinase/D-beta-D-heptose 1-phosphate adenosyltransferase
MTITVIGELCRDVFNYGDASRMCPEAPVPVLVPTFSETNLGMAGNAVRNLESMDKNIKINFFHQTQMIYKTRYVDQKSNQMILRVDEGESNIDPFVLTTEVNKILWKSDAVIISDYDKGFLNETIIHEITKVSKFVIIDSKKILNPIIAGSVTFIKLNESEFVKQNFHPAILDKTLITLGSRGVKYKDKIYPSPSPKETIDVSGAGDTFTAAFTLKYLETKNVGNSIEFANEMASIVVSKRGVATPY